MWCPHLKGQKSYTQLAAEVQQQVTALVLTSEAESNLFLFRLQVSDMIAFTAAQLQALSHGWLHPCLCTASIG